MNSEDADRFEQLVLTETPDEFISEKISAKSTSGFLVAQLSIRAWHVRQEEVWATPPIATQKYFIFHFTLW